VLPAGKEKQRKREQSEGKGGKDFFKINLNWRDKLKRFDCFFEKITETELALFG